MHNKVSQVIYIHIHIHVRVKWHRMTSHTRFLNIFQKTYELDTWPWRWIERGAKNETLIITRAGPCPLTGLVKSQNNTVGERARSLHIPWYKSTRRCKSDGLSCLRINSEHGLLSIRVIRDLYSAPISGSVVYTSDKETRNENMNQIAKQRPD